MAQIDKLIGVMAQRQADRAILINDQPVRMIIKNQPTLGVKVSATQLESLLREVVPTEVQAAWTQDGTFQFLYESPHGQFTFNIRRNGSGLHTLITPFSPATDIAGDTDDAAPPLPIQIPASRLVADLPTGSKVGAVAFSPDGSTCAIGCADSQIRLLDLESGQIYQTLSHGGITDLRGVTSLSYSPHGQTLASGSINKISVWDINTGKAKWTKKGLNQFYCIACSPDGETIAVGDPYGEINWWDIDSGKLVRSTDKRMIKGVAVMATSPQVHFVAFSADGKLLASARGREIKIWNAQDATPYSNIGDNKGLSLGIGLMVGTTGAAILGAMRSPGDQESDFLAVITCLAFSPNGRMIATGGQSTGNQNKANLWDIRTGERYSLNEHSRGVTALTFSPDGRILVTATNTEVKLWDAHAQEMQRTLRDHRAKVNAVTISPDGTLLASGGDDQTVKLWRLG